MITETFPILVGEDEVTDERRLTKGVICGHRDMAGATPKVCPCFDAHEEYMSL